MQVRKGTEAFGQPGVEPSWTHSNKSGVGTAYSTSSHLWFTIWNGIVTELYYPTVDRPQMRDLQYLISDGQSFFHEEKRDLRVTTERISEHALGYRCTNSDPHGRYRIEKEIISDPHLPCLLQRTRVSGSKAKFLSALKLYALCAPHLENGGKGNSAYVAVADGRQILMAQKGGKWIAMAATTPFSRVSCGYVGKSDGWTDLHDNFTMDWQFDQASDGNVALTGELDLSVTREFTLGVAFGNSEHRAVANLLQSLAIPFKDKLSRFQKEWDDDARSHISLAKVTDDHGRLYSSSMSLLHAHEDKSFPGALIASLTIPWGEANGDSDEGGYHLVWTRDMVNSATALLAAGDAATPLRALIYLAVSQQPDGGFAQNFWVNGEPYWAGIQLDEVAFPLMLAGKLRAEGALADFDAYPLVLKGASYLLRNGPVTQQERWEEASGYSPSTIAASIAALICASLFFRERGDPATAMFVEQYADYLEQHVEEWTVTKSGSLDETISTYYMRMLPEKVGEEHPAENPESRVLKIKNHGPVETDEFPARNVVDGGFLQLVRYGVRAADDPVIVSTVKVIDKVIKVNTPSGPAWHRYNHDGYGQQADGSAFQQHGVGRVWPLLTGERGHYELAAGRSTRECITTMEGLASKTGLLPEQSWDEADQPESGMFFGRPSGSAMPLMWAHAEYVKLLRSTADGKVYDLIPDVAKRYLGGSKKQTPIEIWKPNRRVRFMRVGELLRVHGTEPFVLRWSNDEWKTQDDSSSGTNALEIEYVDLPDLSSTPGTVIRFTFFYPNSQRWEGQDYAITVR